MAVAVRGFGCSCLVVLLGVFAAAQGAQAQAEEGPESVEQTATQPEPQSEQQSEPTQGAAQGSAKDSDDEETYEDDGDDAEGAESPGKDGSKSKSKSKSKTKADNAQAQAPADYHAATPAVLRDRLRAVALGSLGLGTGPSESFSSDLLGFSAALEYVLTPETPGPGRLLWTGSLRYAAHTGVNKKRSQDAAVQRFLVGGGLEIQPASERLRYGIAAELGLYKAKQESIRMHSPSQRDYGLQLGLMPYMRWQLAPKVWIVSAADLAPVFDYSWYALAFGAAMVF